MITSVLDTLGPWAWIILGLALMGLETIAPGVFFLWLGLAAILTGLADWAFGLSWQTSALSFAVLSVVAVLAGRAITRRPDEEDDPASNLNRRAHALLGQTFRPEARSSTARGASASATPPGA